MKLMGTTGTFFGRMALSVWLVLLIFLGIYIFPWRLIFFPESPRTVTVTGSAQKQTKNQIATFTAGVSSVSDKKEEAINEVNKKMNELVAALKGFGVKTEDIKTQSNSIYQTQESYYDSNGVQKSRPGQWSVSNSVEITLREVDRAAALADLLAKTGANNVYGPNFMMDQTSSFEEGLMSEAIENARKKADAMAKSTGATIGEVMSVVEGFNTGPIYPMARAEMGGGGGAVVEPGSSTVAKMVTVTFRLR